MAEQFTGHVSPPLSRDHFTALPLVEFLKSIKNRNNKYRSKPNIQLAFSGISSFSDWLLIC